MFLDKDLPIIGQWGLTPSEVRLLRHAAEGLERRCKPLSFLGQSLILDAKGKPFKHRNGDVIRFRRYNKEAL